LLSVKFPLDTQPYTMSNPITRSLQRWTSPALNLVKWDTQSLICNTDEPSSTLARQLCCRKDDRAMLPIHRVSKKTVRTYFLSELCQISTDCENLWNKDGKEYKIFWVYSFASCHLTNLCQRTTVLNADVPNCYTVSQKKLCKHIFCQNFVKFSPIVKIFGVMIAEKTSFSVVYSFSTSPNLCQRTTVLNAGVPNCDITQ